MSKNTIYKVGLLLIIFLSSCSDWLNLKPQDVIIRDQFWKTKEDVYLAVMGCYGSLLDGGLVTTLFAWGELRADMVIPYTTAKNEDFEIYNGNVQQTNPHTNWRALYQVINYCNTVIEFAPEVLKKDKTFQEEQLNKYLAEVLTIRSLMYFHLVRTFGEVPLKLNATINEQEDLNLPKRPQEEVLNQIINDLETAEKYAVTTYNNNDFDKGRVTKYTVNALQADVYLWMEQYENCIQACDKIINSNQFGLVTRAEWFKKLFVTGNSSESIFELQFGIQKQNPFLSLFWATGRRFNASSVVLDQIYTIDYATFGFPVVDNRGDGASLKASGLIWKYIGLDRNISRSVSEFTSHYIIYRYADILLLKAEALAQIDKGGEALDLVSIIRQRGGAVPSSKEKEDTTSTRGITRFIVEERARELAFEGKRWYDVLRNAKRNNYSNLDILLDMVRRGAPLDRQQSIINKYKDPNSHYFPIFQFELETNKKLKQNPYYK